MITLTVIVFCTLAFFGGVCVGAVLNSMSECSAPHLMEMEDSYQPFETVCINDFDESAKVLIKYLAENHHPHTIVIVTSTNAQLLEGVTSTGEITDFLKD